VFQITLRAARISFGYTAKEAAKACGISKSTMSRYEIDSDHVPLRTALKLVRLYGVSMDLIYWGKESNCFEHNRSHVMKATVVSLDPFQPKSNLSSCGQIPKLYEFD
jgi:DNA-binding XRE family transcriptional regulator